MYHPHVSSLNKPSLRLAQFHKPSSMTLYESCSSYSWNHSIKLDTLVNQDDHVAPIRNPIRGHADRFFKIMGFERVPSLSQLPLRCWMFALAPIYAPSERKINKLMSVFYASVFYFIITLSKLWIHEAIAEWIQRLLWQCYHEIHCQ